MGANRLWQESSGFWVRIDRRAREQEECPVRKPMRSVRQERVAPLPRCLQEGSREGIPLGWLLKRFPGGLEEEGERKQAVKCVSRIFPQQLKDE